MLGIASGNVYRVEYALPGLGNAGGQTFKREHFYLNIFKNHHDKLVLSSDFVTNSYGVSRDSSCEQITSPTPESLSLS